MKKYKLSKVLCILLIIACLTICLAGCNFGMSASEKLDFLADSLALSLLGNDAFAWNVFSVNPEQSYGAELQDNPQWYSYSEMTEEDLSGLCTALKFYKQLLATIKTSKLTGKEMITYRTLDDTLNTYLALYDSPRAMDFVLISGSYISAEGGYVADFASMVENYSFRNETDVKNVLSMTISTETAFATYLDYASARARAGLALFDYTLNAMQKYLNDIVALGENYYLYDFVEHKIDSADFLSESAKAQYKTSYKNALNNNFMDGVTTLSEGLDAYKGHVTETEYSYLAAYGQVGREYYQWCFENKTGIRNADMTAVYNELVNAYNSNVTNMDRILESVDGLQDTDKAVYDEFYEYFNGDKVYLGLTDPQEIIEYLKVAAKNIVPDLQTVPEISFKYLDSTVEEISSSLAYYLRSPMDDSNSSESITLNGYQLEQDPSNILTTIAHEGYPGHLYAHVYEKQLGVKLVTTLNSSIAFSEGWAMYVELAVLKQIASETDSDAVKLYCEYNAYEIQANYLNSLLFDMAINYFGNGVADYVGTGMEESKACRLIEWYMEKPSVYISYGYGMYYMVELHNKAMNELGNAYNEVEFNGKLLSDGFGPTLTRAEQLTEEYISSKR